MRMKKLLSMMLAAGLAAGMAASPALAGGSLLQRSDNEAEADEQEVDEQEVDEQEVDEGVFGETDAAGRFLPITAARRNVESMPAYINDYANEDGQIYIGGKSLYCSGTYTALSMTEGGEEAYPALAARFEELNAAWEENAKKLLDLTWQGGEAACTSGVNTKSYGYYTSSMELFFARADEKALSFMRHDVWYDGDINSKDSKTAWSINPETGADLTVEDVFADKDAAYELLKAKMETEFSAEYSPELYPSLERYFNGEAVEGISMTVGYENIAFYIAPQVATMNETVVEYLSYSELGAAVDEEYTGHQTDYAIDVLCTGYFTGDFSADLNGTGDPVEVYLYATEGEYNLEGASIICDNQYFSLPLYAFTLQTKLIRDQEGKYTIYMDAESENDWHQTYVVKYENGTWAQFDEFEGNFESRYSYEYVEYSRLMLDPKQFKIESRAQTLSTVGICREARVGADGMPEFMEDYWRYIPEKELTTTVELSANYVDEAGNITGSCNIPAGTVLTMYRTDRSGTEDLIDQDGNIYRFSVDTSSWPRMVDGYDIQVAFEGTMFAG